MSTMDIASVSGIFVRVFARVDYVHRQKVRGSDVGVQLDLLSHLVVCIWCLIFLVC